MFIRKMLVAGLAVVGIVGMVSAQPNIADKINGAQTGRMEVSYEVKLEATMTVTPKTLKDAGLLIQADRAGDNLGRINVKTNYPHWDITVASANGLVLKNNPNSGSVMSTGKPLMIKGHPDSSSESNHKKAILDVYIGILTPQLNSVVADTYAKFSDTISSSDTVNLKHPNIPISLAHFIGKKLASSNSNKLSQTGDQTGDVINSTGFAPPTNPNNAGLTFCVGAGLGETPIAGVNENGIYTETLTFTLIAGF